MRRIAAISLLRTRNSPVKPWLRPTGAASLPRAAAAFLLTACDLGVAPAAGVEGATTALATATISAQAVDAATLPRKTSATQPTVAAVRQQVTPPAR
ncbi:MAG: hypothetical protein M3014_13735 [Chloroflexota bacterium]|nr:hypothetical protein [Chloroflexota bacterium]